MTQQQNAQLLRHLRELGWTPKRLRELTKAGLTHERIAIALNMLRTYDNANNWSKRYLRYGVMWGKGPSSVGQHILKNIGPGKRLVEIGSGYLRDARQYVEQKGHNVTAIDPAIEGFNLAQSFIKAATLDSILFIPKDFMKVPLANNFEIAASHRTLHLVKPKLRENFVAAIANTLEEGGQLVLSARNPDDFNPEQMSPIEYGKDNEGNRIVTVAEYTDPERLGHKVYFCADTEINKLLSSDFKDIVIRHIQEPEAAENIVNGKQIMTNISLVTGTKKTEAEINGPEELDIMPK